MRGSQRRRSHLDNIVKEPLESLHDDVFGKTFALYGREDIKTFIKPFQIRLQRNNIDSKKIFGGARCLDAGSGSGRGSILMLDAGAASVTAVDISARNIESTRRNVDIFGGKVETHLANLAELPFDDASFDVVWCNGVVMVTAHPDRCLAELARVLKPGGWFWLYVYGAGGAYWYIINAIRERLEKANVGRIIATLRLIGYPVDRVAEFLDDWKAPYLRTYLLSDVEHCLHELGLPTAKHLPYGTDYDTSHRIATYRQDAVWLGEGDIRYFAKKTGPVLPSSRAACEVLRRTNSTYHDKIVSTFGPKITRLFDLTKASEIGTVAAAAKLQYELREMMKLNEPFNVDHLLKIIDDVTELATEVRANWA